MSARSDALGDIAYNLEQMQGERAKSVDELLRRNEERAQLFETVCVSQQTRRTETWCARALGPNHNKLVGGGADNVHHGHCIERELRGARGSDAVE